MFPSEEQVVCDYCDWNGPKDKTKDHYEKETKIQTPSSSQSEPADIEQM